MKKILLAFFISFLTAVIFPLIAYAQTLDPSQIASPLLQSMGGSGGLGSLAFVAVVVQILMFMMNSRLGDLTGAQKYRLSAVLNIVGSIIALKLQGIDTITALTHSTTVAAYQTFFHQGIKQHFERAEEEI